MLNDTPQQSGMMLMLPEHEFAVDSIKDLINAGSELSFKACNLMDEEFLFITKFIPIESTSLSGENEGTLWLYCCNVDKYIPEHEIYDGGIYFHIPTTGSPVFFDSQTLAETLLDQAQQEFTQSHLDNLIYEKSLIEKRKNRKTPDDFNLLDFI
jgi:hypothetical protein